MPPGEPQRATEIIDSFERRFGGYSLRLACHAAVAHRLRPGLLALIRTNFLRGPARFQPAHDADVLYGPLCRSQGDGFFEMPADIRHCLVRLLDLHDVRASCTIFPSQRVARFLRHYLDHVAETDPRYRTPRYRRFLNENRWRAIALDDLELARRHIFEHASARNMHPRESLQEAPRGAGIISVAGPVLGIFRDEMAYLAAQDLIADGRSDEGVSVLQAIGDVELQMDGRALASPVELLNEELVFRSRRENAAPSEGHGRTRSEEQVPASDDVERFDAGLQVDTAKVALRETALHAAVRRGDLESVMAVLEQMPEEIDVLGDHGLAPLHLAAKAGREDIAELLIERGADIDRFSALKATPLYFAAERGALGLSRRLLERGADATRPNARNSTVLMAACRYGHPELVDLILSAPGVDAEHVDARDDGGYFALMGTVQQGSTRNFDRLLAAGASVPKPRDWGWSLLHAAAFSGNVALAARLLGDDHPVDATALAGWTPLHVAAQRKKSDVAQLLLECGADSERPQAYGWTPAQLAAYWDAAEVLETLRRYGASMTLAHPDGRSPFLIAAASGAARVMTLLLKLDEVDPTGRASRGKDPMTLAIEFNNVSGVEVLLDSPRVETDPAVLLGAAIAHGKPDVIRMLARRRVSVPEPPEGAPPWIWAAVASTNKNRDEVLAALIDMPAMPLPDERGTPIAVTLAREALVASLDALIARGVPLDDADERGETPLGAATAADHIDIVKRLLAAGADANRPSGLRASPPILLAKGNVLLALIACGADVTARMANGRTALHLAAERKCVAQDPGDADGGIRARDETTSASHDGAEERALLAAGASVDARDLIGRTPLHLAADAGRKGRAEVLLQHGAALDARAEDGFTPLLCAIAAGHTELAEFLLDSGADANARLPGGWTALHLAAERDLAELVERLWPLVDDPRAPAAEPPLTSLQAAAEAGASAAVEKLIELGAARE